MNLAYDRLLLRPWRYSTDSVRMSSSLNGIVCNIYKPRQQTIQESRAVAGNPRDAAVIFDP